MSIVEKDILFALPKLEHAGTLHNYLANVPFHDESVTSLEDVAEQFSAFVSSGAPDSCVFAKKVAKMMAHVKYKAFRRRFEQEAQNLLQIVEDWKKVHQDVLDLDQTSFSEEVLRHSSGDIRFQLIIVSKEGQRFTLEKWHC